MVAIRSFSSGGDANTTGKAVAKPAGAVDLDRIITFAISDDVVSDALSPNPTTGWTQKLEIIGSGTANGGGTGRTLRVWERVHNGDGANYTWARAGAAGSWMALTFAIQDLDASSVTVAVGDGTATGKVLTAPAPGAYVGDNPFVLFCGALIADNGSSDATWTTPTGFTTPVEFSSDAYLQGFVARDVTETGHPTLAAAATTATIAAYTNVPWLAAQVVIPTVFATNNTGLFLPF